MDDHRVNPMEERALTNAIERAATVASINTDLDRNQLLANQLKKANIDPKFAKTASQAFNKRLTVLTFQKTADEHKADSFSLTDADVVYGLVSGAAEKSSQAFIEKAAAFKMNIETTEDEPAMEKAASVKFDPSKLYEHRVSMDTFEEHLDSMMDKFAAATTDLNCKMLCLKNKIEAEANEVATLFKQAHYNYDFTTAVNLYGDKLKAAIGDKLDKEASFIPTSKFVIKPQKAIFDKVAKLISDREALENLEAFTSDFAKGVNEFLKSASDLSHEWQFKKVAAPTAQDWAQTDYDALNQRYTEALANATANGTGPAKAMAAADLLVGGLAGGAQAGIKSINDITGAARTALGNARALYSAGNNVSISPGDLLDAAFLTKDRYRDRLLAWSDMSADPQLSLYPAEQVFQATNKAMDMDTSLERPDQREVLRTQVAQLLAQNNRVSTADIAALASTLKALSSVRSNAAVEGSKAVAELSDKTAPAAPELKDIIGVYGKDTEGLKSLADATDKDFDRQIAFLDKANETATSAKQKQIDALGKSVDQARGRIFQALSTGEQQEYSKEQKRLDRENALAIAEAENKGKLDVQNAADKAALGRARLQHMDYRQYLDMLNKLKESGNTNVNVEPPKQESDSPKPQDTDDKKDKGGDKEKQPKQPKKTFDESSLDIAKNRYPTKESRDKWAQGIQRYVDKNKLTKEQLVQSLRQSDPEKTNGHEWLLGQDSDRVFTVYDDAGGIEAVPAEELRSML